MSNSAFPTLAALESYLLASGWRVVDRSGPAGDTWVSDDSDAPAILVPRRSDEGKPEFGGLMNAAVDRLAWASGLAAAEMLRELARPVVLSDLLEVRFEDRFRDSGRISLASAPRLAQTLYEVVLNGARREFLGPRVAYSQASVDVDRALEAVDMLAPAAGSFRLIAASAVPEQFAINDSGTPDGPRRAMSAAMDALGATRDALEAPTPDSPDDLDAAVERGMSTNLLRHLDKIDNHSGSLSVSFTASWRDGSVDPGVPAAVEFTSKHFGRVGELRAVLRKNEPYEGPFGGLVVRVGASSADPEILPPGVVIVEAIVDSRVRRVHVELEGPELYQTRAGSTRLDAVGRVEKIKGHWHLTSHSKLDLTDIRK